MDCNHSYENYSETSRNYDKTRIPIGVSLILSFISREPPFSTIRVLDAGCGTGSYLIALQKHCGHLAGLEINQGMLKQARRKASGLSNISLYQGSVLAMPFARSSFDVTLFNQVIHHLDADTSPEKQGWINVRQVVQEAYGVLRPGGHLIINTCNQEQLRHGFWYTTLIPHAVERLARRYIPIEDLCDILTTCGFEVNEIDVPIHETFFGIDNLETYLDPKGPLHKPWRDGDSIWSLAPRKELDTAKKRLQTLIKSGQANNFVQEQDKIRQKIGQAQFIHARRR